MRGDAPADRRDGSLGFTLVEAMVALAVVAMVAVAVLAQAGAGSRSSVDAIEAMTAAALAEEQLERMRILEPDELTRLPDSLRSGRFDAPFEAYAWTAEAEPLRDDPDLVEVSVVIAWDGGSFPLRTRWYRP